MYMYLMYGAVQKSFRKILLKWMIINSCVENSQ